MTTPVTGDLPAEQERRRGPEAWRPRRPVGLAGGRHGAGAEPPGRPARSGHHGRPDPGPRRLARRRRRRFPAKAVVGEPVPITATVFREGHDAVAATAVLRRPRRRRPTRVRMTLARPGHRPLRRHRRPRPRGPVVASGSRAGATCYGTWEHAALIKVPAGLDVELDASRRARACSSGPGACRAGAADAGALEDAVAALRDTRRDPQRAPRDRAPARRCTTCWPSTRCATW